MTFMEVDEWKFWWGKRSSCRGGVSQICFLNVQLSSCPASRDLLQVKAEPVSKLCVVYVKTGFKNETKPLQNQQQRKEDWVKEWEITETTAFSEAGGENTPGHVQIFPAARGKPVLEQISCWAEVGREPMPEQGEWQRNHCELIIMSSSSSLCCLGQGWGSLEWRNESILIVNKLS